MCADKYPVFSLVSRIFAVVKVRQASGVIAPAVIAATLAIGANQLPAHAADSATQQKQVNAEMSKLRDQMGEMTEDEADLLKKIDELTARKADLESKTKGVQDQIKSVETQLADANARLASVQVRVDQAQRRLDDVAAQLNDNQVKLQNHAIDAYMGGTSEEGLASYLLRGGDVREVTVADEYRSQVVVDKKDLIEQQRELQNQATDARRALDQVLNDAQTDRDVIATQSQNLEAQKASLQMLQDEADVEAKRQGDLLVEVESKRAGIMAKMDNLQRQSDSIAERLRAEQQRQAEVAAKNNAGRPARAPAPIPVGRGVLSNPLPGFPMTSPFGMRQDPVLNRYQLHAGQDFAAPMGVGVRSAADGRVFSVLPSSASGGYGNYVCIDHGNGMATCYAHLSQFLVKEGQMVVRGQQIGLVGSTGYSTGPHLHFEVRINGTPVDPRIYL